jgi:hypothetical protein
MIALVSLSEDNSLEIITRYEDPSSSTSHTVYHLPPLSLPSFFFCLNLFLGIFKLSYSGSMTRAGSTAVKAFWIRSEVPGEAEI